MRRNAWRRALGAVAVVLAGLLPAAPAAAAPVPAAKYALAAFGYDQGWRTDRHIRTLVDITRDGKADIVAFGDDGVWTSIALGGGGFAPPKFVLAGYSYNSGWRVGKHPRWAADITGDGFADLVGAGPDGVWTAVGKGDGSFGPMRFVAGIFGSNGRPGPLSVQPGDANLDGRTDLYAFSDGRVDVSLATGDGGFALPYLATAEFTADRFDFAQFKVANIGGDKRPDILSVRYRPALAPMSAIARPDGTYGASQTSTSAEDQSANAIFSVADITGDGYADAVRFGGDANTYTGRATGAGTFTTFGVGVGYFGYNNGTGYGTSSQPSPSIGDVTHDGRADIVGFGSTGVMSAVSRGDGTFGPARLVNADFGSGSGWTVARHPRVLADITGDGAADVVGFGDKGVFVAVADGSGGFGGGQGGKGAAAR
ncbi:FG-GAP repeat domain-containing protein [Lentzea flava]|uniref:FG-GAP repeat domain-containing protein n=1 Tax=Lentzea flava TaxID=103732 RepID=UPI001670CE49|nr:VCBS repeat-containing protein [Lentzea flava]MCP2202171.1 Repeat domain-containing protein [Lentzea flava]